MNPEEKHLLERTLKLSEENNKLLKKINRRAKWSFVWGIIKIALVVVPLVIGYFYFEPYLNEAADSYGSFKQAVDMLTR